MTTILPSVAVLELTYRCNHTCRFCSCPWFAGMLKPGQEMEVGEWKRLVEAYSAAGVTQFSFTGGEALLKEGCLELMDFAAKRAKVGLLSNGRSMTEDVLRFCAERGIHVLMSMPGLQSFAANTDSDTPVEHILSMFGRRTNSAVRQRSASPSRSSTCRSCTRRFRRRSSRAQTRFS